MKTVRIKIYQFNELNDHAKQKAIQDYRREEVYTDYIYDDAHESVNKFHDIFGTTEGGTSWLDIRTGHIDDNILNLKGVRLRTYIINNFWSQLYKPKTFYNGDKQRKSKITLDNCCILTGVCYDLDLLNPIYDFLERYQQKADYYSYMDFDRLLQDCINSLEKSIQSEVDYRNSDEGITEELENNEREYTKDGKEFINA